MKIFLNKNTHVGTDEPADKTKTWLPQNLSEEVNFLSNPATYGVLSEPRVKIAEGLDAQNIDAYGEKLRVYEVEPSTLIIKEYKNGAWVNIDLNINVPEIEDELAGTWYLNNSLSGGDFYYNVHFLSNDKEYIAIYADGDLITGNTLYYEDENGSLDTVYTEESFGGASNNVYRYLNVSSKLADVTDGDALLTWLKANATKQKENQAESIVGTWYFNSTLTAPSFSTADVVFTSNNSSYIRMSYAMDFDEAAYFLSYLDPDGGVWTFRYGSDSWTNSNYRTITITSEPTDTAFIEWLKANATKQASGHSPGSGN